MLPASFLRLSCLRLKMITRRFPNRANLLINSPTHKSSTHRIAKTTEVVILRL